MALAVEQRLDVLALQECESLHEKFEEFPISGGFKLLPPVHRNGVGMLLSNRIYSCMVDHFVYREACAVLCDFEGTKVVLLNWHLPDHKTELDRGVSLEQILAKISCALDKWWVSSPWAHIAVMGDFNTVHPGDSALCSEPLSSQAVSRYEFRADLIQQFFEKHGISWFPTSSPSSPAFASEFKFTHQHYNSCICRIIDYICCYCSWSNFKVK